MVGPDDISPDGLLGGAYGTLPHSQLNKAAGYLQQDLGSLPGQLKHGQLQHDMTAQSLYSASALDSADQLSAHRRKLPVHQKSDSEAGGQSGGRAGPRLQRLVKREDPNASLANNSDAVAAGQPTERSADMLFSMGGMDTLKPMEFGLATTQGAATTESDVIRQAIHLVKQVDRTAEDWVSNLLNDLSALVSRPEYLKLNGALMETLISFGMALDPESQQTRLIWSKREEPDLDKLEKMLEAQLQSRMHRSESFVIRQAISLVNQVDPTSIDWVSQLSNGLSALVHKHNGVKITEALVETLLSFGFVVDPESGQFIWSKGEEPDLSKLEKMIKAHLRPERSVRVSESYMIRQAIRLVKQVDLNTEDWVSHLSNSLSALLCKHDGAKSTETLMEILATFGFTLDPDSRQTRLIWSQWGEPDLNKLKKMLESHLRSEMRSGTIKGEDDDFQLTTKYHHAITSVFASMPPHQVEEVLADLGLGTLYYNIGTQKSKSRKMSRGGPNIRNLNVRGCNGKDIIAWLFPDGSDDPRAGAQQVLARLGKWAQDEVIRQKNARTKKPTGPRGHGPSLSLHIPSIAPGLKGNDCAAHWSMKKRLMRPRKLHEYGGSQNSQKHRSYNMNLTTGVPCVVTPIRTWTR
eukprot:gnl/MRDRNA2_/MRDRNA2_70152_c0_seq1.p1 gnl/MRDRNA2_/MRDRNA2_70152_c0~~gnl/MRDRNA2_/MRDRNA2_70152_c0_seq1.p1  ORF type:complete len:695 (+),score=96.70 gnl/MRDRNA2_/MRDRNA2_70152_c0_seq1:181-2085(+)